MQNKKLSVDKNVWNLNHWRKVNFIWIMCLFSVIEIYLFWFSFTNLFTNNIWIFVAVYKAINIIAGKILEIYLEDEF